MSKARAQLTVYPDLRARAMAAWSTPAANAAIEAFAVLTDEALPSLGRQEWCYLADILNPGTRDASWNGAMVAAEIEDAHRLDGTGYKWFASEAEELDAAVARTSGTKLPSGAVDAHVTAFLAIVRSWSRLQVQSALVAIHWFWAHHEGIDVGADEWWRPEFRSRWEASLPPRRQSGTRDRKPALDKRPSKRSSR